MSHYEREENSSANTLNREFLHNLPEKFLKRLINYLSVNDLLHLSSSCKYFLKVSRR